MPWVQCLPPKKPKNKQTNKNRLTDFNCCGLYLRQGKAPKVLGIKIFLILQVTMQRRITVFSFFLSFLFFSFLFSHSCGIQKLQARDWPALKQWQCWILNLLSHQGTPKNDCFYTRFLWRHDLGTGHSQSWRSLWLNIECGHCLAWHCRSWAKVGLHLFRLRWVEQLLCF